jgi:guanine deaminase
MQAGATTRGDLHSARSAQPPRAIRGPALTFTGDPFHEGVEQTMDFELDAVIVMAGGLITDFGPAEQVLPRLPPGAQITHYGKDALISAGFIDSHVHFAQTPMIAACGDRSTDRLNRYTFPTEQKYVAKDFSSYVAKVFLRECLKNGITSACVYCTVYPQSVDALFEEAERLGMRLAAGKVMMDRNAPANLLDTPRQGYDESKALIAKWHDRGRLLYAISLRFAPTSTREQLEAAGELCREHSDCHLQTHVSESTGEIDRVQELFPERNGYLDVYDHYGLCRPRAVFGHGVHLTEDELSVLSRSGSAIAHCPTSNFFLGNGVFDLKQAVRKERPVRVGLGTNVGAGTSFSILATLNEAYKAARLNGQSLSAPQAFYLATRGTARALYLDDRIGSLAVGMEADIVVLDMKSTSIIDYRMQFVSSFEEALFVQMMMGDDRAVQATYVAGNLQYDRTTPREFLAA